MNGQPKTRTWSDHRDQNDPNERWWENTSLVAEPFNFTTIEQYLPVLEGSFWDALNRGVTQKVWEMAFALFIAFVELPEREAKAFVMRAHERNSYREIGRTLGITHRAAKQIYDRAAVQIQQSIQRIQEERPQSQDVATNGSAVSIRHHR